LLSLLLATCGGPADERPNVILITLDTTRADRIMDPQRTPHITAFAAECLTFTNARSVGSLTLPAHASIMTGLYPPRHTARGNGPLVLPQTANTLAERASSYGYRTAGFVGSLALDRAYGIAQGFAEWDQPARRTGRAVGEISERPGSAVIESVASWFDSEPAGDTRPLFLWVHLFDPHAPYAPPALFLERANGNAYDGEIGAVDAAVGALLANLRVRGLLDDAVVMIVGDHGESLGEHGEATHGLLAYDATLRVPFLLREPNGKRAGTLDTTLVSVVDVQPTLLAAMGIEADPDIDGVNLYDRPAPEGRALYCESHEGWRLYGWSPLAGWIDARGKYLHSSAPELYDLAADPAELHNLWTADFDLTVQADRFRRLAAKSRLGLEPIAPLDERRARELAALGYTASAHEAELFPGVPDLTAPTSADAATDAQDHWSTRHPSPAERIAEARATEDAHALLLGGQRDAAAKRFELLLAENSANLVAADRLIEIRLAQEAWPAALALLSARAKRPPETIATHRDLARCLTALGREAEAARHIRRSLELFILHHERRGEAAEADRYRRILADAPSPDSEER